MNTTRLVAQSYIRGLRASAHRDSHSRLKITKKGGPPAQAVKRLILDRVASVASPSSLQHHKGETYSCQFKKATSFFRFAVTASRKAVPWFNISLTETSNLAAHQTVLLVIWNRDDADTWCKQLQVFCLPTDELALGLTTHAAPIVRSMLSATFRKLDKNADAVGHLLTPFPTSYREAGIAHNVELSKLLAIRDSMANQFSKASISLAGDSDERARKILGDLKEALFTVLLHITAVPDKPGEFVVRHRKTGTQVLTLDESLSACLALTRAETLTLEAAYASTGEVEEEEYPDVTEPIAHPYDPTKSKIDTRPLTIDLLVRRIREDEIDLCPPFQRRAGLWSQKQKSQLVESLLIRIPLPAFYFDATNASRWLVVDGLQRLTTFREFILGDMRLEGLEYLIQCNGKTFHELPRALRRDIEESQVTLHLIQPGTPAEVKFNIFRRVNTGGLVLTPQEIRHALNQGPIIGLLTDLAESREFLDATTYSISSDRMVDREFVLRFLAFTLTSYHEYKVADMDAFLNAQMSRLNTKTTEYKELSQRFKRAMTTAAAIFGSHAFRKQSFEEQSRSPINKALFEAWSVSLGRMSEAAQQLLVEHRQELVHESIELLMFDDGFVRAISQGTADTAKVRKRFQTVENTIANVLKATA